ncbi:MAG TPA: nitronate monooxygenase family protein [Bacillota bacterium]|nr:nitronate monooxygenase family protein [Bacillota bacterium]HQQ45232.1 nitronate monooxygenase family protein [Bacillota bacterium]
MSLNSLKELNIGNLTARLPIIQGGMGVGISLSGLASAVANEGGVGVIAAAGIGMLDYDFSTKFIEANIARLRSEIRKAREKSKGIIGINIMVALSNYAEFVKASIEEGIDIIFSGAGLPLNLPQYLEEKYETKLVPIVSSARAAGIICKKWLDKYNYLPDAIVVEGPKAGGHLGFKEDQIFDPDYSLEKILPEVVDEVKAFEDKSGRSIPVIAAGGIYSGEDIYNIMKLGASGVQMATRFVTTEECDASMDFKKAYINSNKEDVSIIKSPVGMPGRAIRNSFTEDILKGANKPYKCPYHCIVTCDYKNSPYCIALALTNAQKGKLENGFAFAGVNAYRADKVITVKELMDTLQNEYSEAASKEAGD